MSIPFAPSPFMSAVVQHLKTTNQLHTPVEANPDRDEEYRLVCLTPHVSDAQQLAHLLQAVGDGRYRYTVCLAETVTAHTETSPPLPPSTV